MLGTILYLGIYPGNCHSYKHLGEHVYSSPDPDSK